MTETVLFIPRRAWLRLQRDGAAHTTIRDDVPLGAGDYVRLVVAEVIDPTAVKE